MATNMNEINKRRGWRQTAVSLPIRSALLCAGGFGKAARRCDLESACAEEKLEDDHAVVREMELEAADCRRSAPAGAGAPSCPRAPAL